MPGERIHVVGVAGAGASAAALLGQAARAVVSGCDPGAPSPYTLALDSRAIPVEARHDPAHVTASEDPPDRLAVTKALTSVQPDHPELVAARSTGIPLEPWQQVVADAAATQGGRLVAVAGTHGKSTSSGWLVHLLVMAGRDPAAFVGALLPTALTGGEPATARWGRGDVFVVEADEYAGNFDPYRPWLAVVLNADWDHPDVFADRREVVDAFEAWLRAGDDGARLAVIHVGDEGGRELAARLADWGARVVAVVPDLARATDQPIAGTVRYELKGDRLTIRGLPWPPVVTASPAGGRSDELMLRAHLRLPGAHYAADAACVATAASLLGLSADEIAAGLGSFEGVGRRMDVKGQVGGVLVIDDYGHHPTAIRATIAAVRARHPGRHLWVAHEPLTYHRAAAMLDGLASALAEADDAVIADIWAGRDRDTTITSARAVAAAVTSISHRHVEAPGSVEATADFLAQQVRPGDVVLTMGGGRSYVIADRLLADLGERDTGADPARTARGPRTAE